MMKPNDIDTRTPAWWWVPGMRRPDGLILIDIRPVTQHMLDAGIKPCAVGMATWWCFDHLTTYTTTQVEDDIEWAPDLSDPGTAALVRDQAERIVQARADGYSSYLVCRSKAPDYLHIAYSNAWSDGFAAAMTADALGDDGLGGCSARMSEAEVGQVIVPRVPDSGPEAVTLELLGTECVFVTVGEPDEVSEYGAGQSRLAVVYLNDLIAACLTLSESTAPQVDELLANIKARRNRHVEYATTQVEGSYEASFTAGQIQEAERVCEIVAEWAARHGLSKAEV